MLTLITQTVHLRELIFERQFSLSNLLNNIKNCDGVCKPMLVLASQRSHVTFWKLTQETIINYTSLHTKLVFNCLIIKYEIHDIFSWLGISYKETSLMLAFFK